MDNIAVTGMGVVSPLGSDVQSLWNALVKGVSGIERIDALEGLPVNIGGPAKGFDPTRCLSRKDLRHMDRFSQFALVASLDALESSNLDKGTYPEGRMGVIIGSGAGGVLTLESQIKNFNEKGARRVSPLTVPMHIINIASGLVAMRIGARGPGMGVSTACATGGHAIAVAARLIQTGDADCMVAGGVEAVLTPFAVSAFAAMKALSTRNNEPGRASRPFDIERDGFVMAEGGAVFVLENMETARKRGAGILAVIKGIGMSQDAYHMVAPHPEGRGAVIAMKRAIEDAGISPEQVDYINAHGTSTPLNDSIETRAIKEVFGDHAYRLKVSSSKSMTGHLIGGAAGLETAICILALNHGVVPPTINLDNPDPECDLDYVPNTAQRLDMKYCMNNAFGFGGQNMSLVIGRNDS